MCWSAGPLGMNAFAKKDLSVGVFDPGIVSFHLIKGNIRGRTHHQLL